MVERSNVMQVIIMNRTNLLVQQFNNATRIEYNTETNEYVITDGGGTTHAYPKSQWVLTVLFS
jgi:hypothetical protein